MNRWPTTEATGLVREFVAGAQRRAALFTLVGLMMGTDLALALDPSLTVDEYTRRHWSIEEGLPQVSVNAIVQDRHGYLWIGTFGGVVRFDGVRVVRLDAEPGCSDRVLSLAVGDAGELWAGSERSGLCRTVGDRLVPFEAEDGADLGGIAQILPSGDRTLWLATSRGLVHIRGDSTRRYGTEHGLHDPNVLALAAHPDGPLWVATKAGLCIFSDGDCRTPTWARQLVGSRVTALHHGAFGASWIGSEQGLYWVKDGRVERVNHLPDQAEIGAIGADRNGGLWVGLRPGGLLRILPRQEILRGFDTATNDTVRSIFEDREGNLWVGTDGSGLFKLSAGAATGINLAPGPGSLPAGAILAEDDGQAWAGSFCGGLARIGQGATRFLGVDDGLGNTCVSALARGTNGTLWVGTLGGGLFRMTAAEELVSAGGPTTTEGLVRAIAEDGAGGLLVGTDTGLFRHDPATGAFDLVDGTGALDVFFIDPSDPEGTWLGTRQGAVLLGRTGHRRWGRAEGLAHPEVRAIHRDETGAVWIGSYGGGLYRLQDDQVFSFSTRSGLPDRAVSSIVEDPDGQFWMTGNLGVTRAARTALEAFASGTADRIPANVFDSRHGMPATETNGGFQPAASLDPEGRLWVPTVGGLAVFDTDRENFNMLPPPVLVEQVLVDGVELDPDARAVLTADARNLEIRYTALAFTAPEKIRFRVRLIGYDDDWVETGNRRVAYYPVIPPGELRFRVVAANEDGVWNLEGDDFSFEMKRRATETPTFWLAIIALAVALSLAVYRLRLLAARHRERILREEVDRRTAELARLSELTEVINEAVTIEEVMDRLYDDLRPIVPYDRIGLALFDEDRLVLRSVWARGERDQPGIDLGFELPVEETSLGQLLESGKPRIIEDLERYLGGRPGSDATRRLLADGIRSSLTCPLRAMGNPVGLVFFSSSVPSTYTSAHVAFLEQIAGHLSLIVVKSKLYDELNEANQELDRLASLDALTGLPNRRPFEEHLASEWRRAARGETPLGILMVDVDAFKQYNDLYGHLQGDEALKLVADVLRETAKRPGDIAARIGGEEFAVILEGADVEASRQLAERLRNGVEARALPHAGSPCSAVLTISVGVASLVPAGEAEPEALQEAADRALYAAKEAGRNRVQASGDATTAKAVAGRTERE